MIVFLQVRKLTSGRRLRTQDQCQLLPSTLSNMQLWWQEGSPWARWSCSPGTRPTCWRSWTSSWSKSPPGSLPSPRAIPKPRLPAWSKKEVSSNNNNTVLREVVVLLTCKTLWRSWTPLWSSAGRRITSSLKRVMDRRTFTAKNEFYCFKFSMLTNFNRKKSESVTRFSNFICNPGDIHTSLIQISSHSIHYGKWNSRQGER